MKTILSLLLATSLLGCSLERASEDESAAASHNAVETIAKINFDAAFNETVTGTLRAGSKVEITYDPSRLTTCRGTEGGRPQWGISGSYRIGADTAPAGFTIAGLMEPVGNKVVIELPRSGELEIWFTNTSKYGCVAYDSNYGANYRFKVENPANAPGFVGNAASVISRETCHDGLACEKNRVPLTSGFRFETWAGQRALIAGAYFDVWKEGVTDFDNPDLWKQIDAKVFYRQLGATSWKWAYVNFEKRVGNDARYVVPLRSIDPLGGSTITTRDKCPEGPITVTPDGFYVQTDLDMYFTVNGITTPTYRGTYVDYKDLYKVCL
jgi:hypothetical protein